MFVHIGFSGELTLDGICSARLRASSGKNKLGLKAQKMAAILLGIDKSGWVAGDPMELILLIRNLSEAAAV